MNVAAAVAQTGVKPEALLERLQGELNWRRDGNRLAAYEPYAKQAEFHRQGKTRRERLLMAANQVGKTVAGGNEAAIHLTGRYPPGWEGHVFGRPIRMWASGVTNLTTRDIVQAKLVGPPQRQEEWGTGFIPRDAIVGKPTRAQGVPDMIDSIQVRHVSGAVSHLAFKSYEQGREKWQAETLDALWCDEEPPQDIYTEGRTRMNAVPDARAWITFTPLKGMSEVVKSFLLDRSHPDRGVVTMTIDDAGHLSVEQRAIIVASYQPWELEARTKGIPSLGSGRVFPITEESIRWEAKALPKHFKRICGLDFGWDHPTAAVWMTWDVDSDKLYITDCYRQREATPIIHAAAIKARGLRIPVAWPHDGLQHDKGSGEQLAQLYRNQGVTMLPERAEYPDDRGNGVEAGVIDMLERMQTDRLKVAVHLADWWEEFRLYHREDGKIVKVGDDLMAATRYGIMCLRFAKADGAHPSDRYKLNGNGGSRSAWAA